VLFGDRDPDAVAEALRERTPFPTGDALGFLSGAARDAVTFEVGRATASMAHLWGPCISN
jgi:hypothetical protein